MHWLTNEKIFSFEPYQDITGCITINILPSFAESRQMKVCSWMLFALLATAVSVGRGQDYAVCARRDELSYDAAKLKFSCYAASLSLLFRKKSQDFFRGGEAAKIFRAVVLTAAYRFELASTMSALCPAAGSVKKAFSGSFFALKSCRVVRAR